ncbi:MAG: hypothetical protein K8T26_19830 [Lentisphaerae bacterium]|nr:hypothetical protein [Lentisphaerota bacterium]
MKKIDKEQILKWLDRFADKTGIRIMPDRLPHPSGDDVTTLDVPGYRQIDSFSCGAAAALMVVRTFRPGFPAGDFHDLCSPDDGIQVPRLIRFLRKSGIGVIERDDLTFARIAERIDAGFPIITLVNQKDDLQHWVVIYGVGLKPNRVYVGGMKLPIVGRKEYTWREFSRMWFKGFGLVCWGKLERKRRPPKSK